ncbi:hypothetical protein [Aquiflexum sp. TKW24L]|uniref:hypothetical protein n=1 Tax=Aquiflexum sp. TKW24L TaxID=2942212 RepID=UPI0020C0FE59|nr:hypothetical protein [Aquiflexum sp. TKW24L]
MFLTRGYPYLIPASGRHYVVGRRRYTSLVSYGLEISALKVRNILAMGEAHRYHEEWFQPSPERVKEIDLKNILFLSQGLNGFALVAKDFLLPCFWRNP